MAIRALKFVPAPTTFDHAILRDANGNLLQTGLSAEEIEMFQWLAEHDQVRCFRKTRKGKRIVVFRLVPPPEPPPDPSSSRVTDCSLTHADMRQLALRDFTRKRIERWMGWGLLKPAKNCFKQDTLASQ